MQTTLPPDAKPARILLIDDHQIICDGLQVLLHEATDLELIGNAYDVGTGWRAVQTMKPDLVVMDLNVPGGGGVALTERIHAEFPDIKVVVLSAHAEAQRVQAALSAGAMGYVVKGRGFRVLLEALRATLGGKTYLCPEVSAAIVQQLQRRAGEDPAHPVLSEREAQVLRQLADGLSTKEIAFNLGVSAKTIESHRAKVMAKLGLKSIAELTKYAVREGLSEL